MRAELKRIHSPDVDDLSAYSALAGRRFCLLVQAMVGPEGQDCYESFDIIVCSPAWLLEEVERGPVVGTHHVIMARFAYEELVATIRTFCQRCEGATWQEVARMVGRLGRWEFEDYRE